MKKILFFFLFLSGVVNAEENNEVLEALNQAKLYGSELHDHTLENDPTTLKGLELDKKLYKALQRKQCRGHKYKYWTVNHSDWYIGNIRYKPAQKRGCGYWAAFETFYNGYSI